MGQREIAIPPHGGCGGGGSCGEVKKKKEEGSEWNEATTEQAKRVGKSEQ